jgi:hypothetical protein
MESFFKLFNLYIYIYMKFFLKKIWLAAHGHSTNKPTNPNTQVHIHSNQINWQNTNSQTLDKSGQRQQVVLHLVQGVKWESPLGPEWSSTHQMHNAGWMVCGQATLFCCIPCLPQLTTIAGYVLTIQMYLPNLASNHHILTLLTCLQSNHSCFLPTITYHTYPLAC